MEAGVVKRRGSVTLEIDGKLMSPTQSIEEGVPPLLIVTSEESVNGAHGEDYVLNRSTGDSHTRDKHFLARLAARQQYIELFSNFLEERNEPILRVWFQYFDKSRNGKIGHREFRAGLHAMRCHLDIDGLWTEINNDNSDELFFEDVALTPEQAAQGNTWNDFARWAGVRFSCPRDMVRQLKKAAAEAQGDDPPTASAKDMLFEHEVVLGLMSCGWEHGQEELLFNLMDVAGDGVVALRDLKWLELETRRTQAKEAARKRAVKFTEQRVRGKVMAKIALDDFKALLRKLYGPLFRAWRRVLDADGSMTLQRHELFKVCRTLNWGGNMRMLWKALDQDGSGATTFEELDPEGAQVLAEFKRWATNVWGAKFSGQMFKEADRQGRRKLTYEVFASACSSRGFSHQKALLVAASLDWKMSKSVQEPDIEVLDTWKPPDWLLAEANYAAAEEFKQALLKKYGHYVRGWRSALDKDNSNSCNWHEFCDAAKRIKFTGDIAGAWRAFDDNSSGTISLHEIDPVASAACTQFKLWADHEFGGIRPAFRIIDADKSNQISWREFRSACRSFGYRGDVATLFECLDQQGNKHCLQFDEVSFLDTWDTCDANVDEALRLEKEVCVSMDTGMARKPKEPDTTPGPGAYSVQCDVGSGPAAPTTRHGGAFSFGSRLRKAWSQEKIGPGHYHSLVCVDRVKATKPSWSFGSPNGPPQQILGMSRRGGKRGMLPSPHAPAALPTNGGIVRRAGGTKGADRPDSARRWRALAGSA